jgi:hypothetical protein
MENTRNAVVRWGLTFGLIMALLGSTLSVGARLLTGSLSSGQTPPDQVLPTAWVALLAGCGLDLVYLALFFVAGIMTARQTGRVGAASLAGLLAGGVGALVNATVSVIQLFVFPTTLSSLGATGALNPDTSDSLMVSVIIGAVIGGVFGLLIWGGLGAGLGALGGLIGQNQFRAAHPELAQPYAYAPYPGYPPAGYPPAPPMGAHPPPPPGAYPPPPGAYPPPPVTPYPPTPPTEQSPQSGTYPPPDAFPPSQPG